MDRRNNLGQEFLSNAPRTKVPPMFHLSPGNDCLQKVNKPSSSAGMKRFLGRVIAHPISATFPTPHLSYFFILLFRE